MILCLIKQGKDGRDGRDGQNAGEKVGVEATISVLTVAILHIVALVSPYYGWF